MLCGDVVERGDRLAVDRVIRVLRHGAGHGENSGVVDIVETGCATRRFSAAARRRNETG
jgi:hypothetical protein